MIWAEPVSPVRKTPDILETIKKAEKSVSDFQLYLDVAEGRIARERMEKQNPGGKMGR